MMGKNLCKSVKSVVKILINLTFLSYETYSPHLSSM